MNEHKDKKNWSIYIAIIGGLLVTVILTIGTFSLGKIAGRDTQDAVRNVSILYLSELADRREQVVSSILDGYIRDMDVALGLIGSEDLASIESLQEYQLKTKQLYDLEKFAFVDSNGLIYTSRGTRDDIDKYGIDYENLSEPEISVKNPEEKEKKVIIASPVDNLPLEDKKLVACFMEIDMGNMLRDASLQSNNNTTFCNIYTSAGNALTNMVLGGLASEDNLLEAMKHADFEEGYSYEKMEKDFQELNSGAISFTYNGIRETMYYVPVKGTDWMLTYLIRESVISEKISSISDTIISRGLVQSILTAIILIFMFSLIIIQQRKAAKANLERQLTEAEKQLKEQELEEQIALQSALKDALESAEDANRAKSMFVSNMSHEIRTPITAILGMNEMIIRESTDKNILSYADNINRAGESLLDIISDILDFSKIEAGRLELGNDAYNLKLLLMDLYNLVHFNVEAKGLDLKILTDPKLPVGLIGDQLRLKQIIANLLMNAVKYTEKGIVRLEIKCGVQKDEEIQLVVSVSDTGIGIRPEEMEKLFSPFDRLDISRNRTIEGTGLGLSISRQLLQLMGSDLKVESEYNIGSTFYFDLWQGISDESEFGAFDPASARHEASDDEHKKAFFTAPGKKILIVDDTPMNLQVLTGLLKRTQMIIDTASGGEECIAMFGKNDYDIVFLDYRMPRMDGIETLRRLKEFYPEKAGCTPIIALTASAVAGDRETLLDAGFSDYLSKPVNISDMENMLQKCVAQKEAYSGQELLPEEIYSNNALDCEKGIGYCGDEEEYLFALRTYSESVQEKAGQLEAYVREEKFEDYALSIHSIKSMSVSVGAVSLSERAAALEQSARSGDIEAVRSLTPDFLSDYRKLGEEINSAIGNTEG